MNSHAAEESRADRLESRQLRALAIVILIVLVGLAWLQEALGGTLPTAVGATILVGYAALCLVKLESAFILLLAVAPFSVEMAVPGTGAAVQMPTEPMLLFALGVWLVRTLSRGVPSWRQPGFIRALLLALLTCVISMLTTSFPGVAAKAILNATWYALFGLFLVHNLDSESRLRAIVTAWLVPGFLISVNSVLNVLSGRFDPTQGYWHAAPFFTEHGSFAAYMSFLFFLALAMTIEIRGTARVAFGALTLLFGSQLLLSFTRGAWLGAIVALLPLLVVWRRRLLRPGGILFGVVAIVSLLALLWTGDVSRRLEKHTNTIGDPGYESNLERLNRWYAGWNMFVENPVSGVGYGTYVNHYLNERRIGLATDQSTAQMGIHSEYLRVLAETGVIGFAAALLAGFVLLRFSLRAMRAASTPLRRALALGMAAGLVSYLVHAFVNNFIQYDKAAIPIWTAIGVLGAIATLESRVETG